jgi:hypothetical protein
MNRIVIIYLILFIYGFYVIYKLWKQPNIFIERFQTSCPTSQITVQMPPEEWKTSIKRIDQLEEDLKTLQNRFIPVERGYQEAEKAEKNMK